MDEQHRFGVEQRRALTEGRAPHVLHMTATPIPRTLALTLYGDLARDRDREAAATAQADRHGLGDGGALVRGLQAAAHAPRRGAAGVRRLPADRGVRDVAVRARPRPRPSGCGGPSCEGYRVGLLHGRLRPAERRELMAQFKARELDVLVATTVIEVGVDVPNATIMIVQEADRFGLAQLHQLRGRVGRGAEQSYCLLDLAAARGADRQRAGAAAGAGRLDGRLRAGGEGPRAARRGPAAGARARRGSPSSASRGCGPTGRCSSARGPSPRGWSSTKARSPTRWSESSASATSRPERPCPGPDPEQSSIRFLARFSVQQFGASGILGRLARSDTTGV